jgi:hypothetical protein
MSAPQESGSGLASVIGSPALGKWHSANFTKWKSNLLDDDHPLAQLHAKYWGNSMIDQDQEWRNAQLPVLVTGGKLGDKGQGEDEHMDEDGNEGMYGSETTDLDDDIIPGCCFLDIGIASTKESGFVLITYGHTTTSRIVTTSSQVLRVGHQLPSSRDNQASVRSPVPLLSHLH